MPTPLWSESHFIVLDVEGNGAPVPEIVELAVVHITDERIAAQRHWMVRPEVPVTPQATRVHGIKNEDLKDLPPFAQIAAELRTELGSAPVVGHHVGVDVSLLRRQLPDWHPETCIDTLRLARHVFPDAKSHALQVLYRRVGGNEAYTGHRAQEDALMTARLFLSIASGLGRQVHLDLLALARVGSNPNDPFLQAQQRRLF